MSAHLQASGPVSGHVFRVERKRGPAWYAKYRLPGGRQVQRRLGPGPLGADACVHVGCEALTVLGEVGRYDVVWLATAALRRRR